MRLATSSESQKLTPPDAAQVRSVIGLPLDGAIERIKIDTRRFAKNQRTWLKRFRGRRRGSIWIDAEDLDIDAMSKQVFDQLNSN